MRLRIVVLVLVLTMSACHARGPLDDLDDETVVNDENVVDDGGDDGGGDEDVSDIPPPPLPPADDGPTVSFVIFGDWGTNGTDDAQEEVAAAIGTYCETNPCEFVVTLGDNFYSSGVTSTTDDHWNRNYRNVYGSLGLPFYASLGNHDNNGNIQAQIDYAQIDSSWHMPDEEYTFTMPVGTTPPLVEFFIFNSDYPHFRPDGDDEDLDGYDATTWLNNAITASEARWKFPVMHHPVYSDGNHGDDNQGNNEFLLPLLCDGASARVDLVLSGHDHNFGHLRGAADGCPLEQLVVGTAGATIRTSVTVTIAEVLKRVNLHGFGWLQVSQTRTVFRFINSTGGLEYETSWQKD